MHHHTSTPPTASGNTNASLISTFRHARVLAIGRLIAPHPHGACLAWLQRSAHGLSAIEVRRAVSDLAGAGAVAFEPCSRDGSLVVRGRQALRELIGGGR